VGTSCTNTVEKKGGKEIFKTLQALASIESEDVKYANYYFNDVVLKIYLEKSLPNNYDVLMWC